MTCPDWKRMYLILCGEISEALDALPLFPDNLETYEILEKALQRTEAMYCAGGPQGAEEEKPGG